MQWLNDVINKYTATQEQEASASSPNVQDTTSSKYINPESAAASFKPYTQIKRAVNGFEDMFQRVIQAESGGVHATASGGLLESPKGAKGITQIMPKTGANPGYGIAPLKDESQGEYLRVGKALLRAYTDEFGGDVEKGLAAYNWGPAKVKRAVNKHGADWRSQLPQETANYLNKILGTK